MRHLLAVAVGVLLAGAAAATVQGATRSVTVSPEFANPGDRVTVEIHEIGGMWWGRDLYLMLASRAEEQGDCSLMPGAIKVAEIIWTHDELVHDGFAQFTLPSVPDGDYVLAEEVPGVTCFVGGSITVSASGSPDTAMHRPPTGWPTFAILAAMMALVAAYGIAVTLGRRGPIER